MTNSLNKLGIFIAADVSMRLHVTRRVSSCFAILRQLRCIRRSVPRTVLQSLVTSLVLSRLNCGNATLAGIPGHLVQRLQSGMNAAAGMIFSTSRYNHAVPASAALAENSRTNWLQVSGPSVQAPARHCSILSCWRTQPFVWFCESSKTLFGVIAESSN